MGGFEVILTSMATLLQMAKDGLKARDHSKIEVAISEITGRLFELRKANLEVIEQLGATQAQNRALLNELKELRLNVIERELYVEHNLASETGRIFMAYLRKESPQGDDTLQTPLHYLCYACFERGIKSALIVDTFHARCPVCGQIGQLKTIPPRPRRVGYFTNL